MRDQLLSGDTFADTPPALHVYPENGLHTCDPGYRVPLFVNAAGVERDFSFAPGLRNRMDYLDCDPKPEGPEAYSPQQIAAMHAALSGTRRTLKQDVAP